MSRSHLKNERGIALVLAIFATVVIGALVAGAFFVGRVEQLTGSNTVWATQASGAAESGLSDALATIDGVTYSAMPIWTSASPTEYTIATRTVSGMPTLVYTDSVRRLNNSLFLIRSTGRKVTAGGTVLASQTVAHWVRLAKPTIGVNAAVTVQDPITFNGNSLDVTGINSVPPGWTAADCPTGYPDAGNTDDLVGVRSSTTTGANASDLNNIFGYPAKVVANDPTITSATFENFLDYTFATLASQPGVKVLPNTTPYNGVGPVADNTQTPAVCDKTVLLNLGEPTRPAVVAQCTGYFPVVHGTGSQLKFAAGTRGQGIILVDGDFEIAGGFEWSGLIIVRGQMKITGTGNKINGAILTEGVNVATAGSIAGNAAVSYSRCAIDRAVTGSAVPLALSRGYAQLY